MADPKGFKRLPPGIKWAPVSIDTVPSDWETVQYTITIEPHPDLPTQPILKFRTASLGGMVPTFIASTETFTVPENRQALFAMSIDNEGTLDIEGYLIQVD